MPERRYCGRKSVWAVYDRLSNGRLTLGVGTRGRDDDFMASGLPPRGRGQRLAAQIEEMKRVWNGEERGLAGSIGPPPAQEGAPPIILGALGEASIWRMAALVDGWIMGGGTPEMFSQLGDTVDQVWRVSDRPDRPRKYALAYFALGAEAQAEAVSTIKFHYAWLGAYVDQIVTGTATSPEMVRAYASGFEQAGCDELIFAPGSGRLGQVAQLAEAIA